MPKFSKKPSNFLEQQTQKIKDALQLQDRELDLVESRIPSITHVDPGDILSFSYKGKSFMVLAVSNQRTGESSAIFKNLRTKNNLLSCFVVDHLSKESLGVIISSLDKYREYAKIASYKYMTTLFSLFLGKDKYRTFITAGNISGLSRILAREV